MGAFLDIRASLERFCIEFSHNHFVDQRATAFPTTNLTVGMTVFRSDEDKLYVLESISPLTWTLLDYDHFVFDFDAHAEELEYPQRNFLGIRDLSLMTEGKNFVASCAFGVSMYEDSNLQAHNKIIDKLFTSLYPNTSLNIYDISNNTGVVVDNLKTMNGAEILPVGKANTRVIQFVGAFFATGLTAQ